MSTAFEQNEKIGRGINLANALEAPSEGSWGLFIKPEYFKIIKEAGFTSVRIPLNWSIHSSKKYPYIIEEKFFQRVNDVINQALQSDLIIIINIHHFNELFFKPKKYAEKFLKLWEQISSRYKDTSENLYFELLNEPKYFLTSKKWNKLLQKAIDVIRKNSPNRIILVGPAKWNNIEGFSKFVLPKNKSNLIITFHYYKPFWFTHQGAEWVRFSNLFIGKKWIGSENQIKKIEKHFSIVNAWAKKNNVPINIGEFGTYYKADLKSRVKWTNTVVVAGEKFNFSWNYWEFGAGFGAYNIKENKWNYFLLDSLIQK